MSDPPTSRSRHSARAADLSTEAEELASVYRDAPIGLCVVDRELRYVRANRLYQQIVGRGEDELVGRSVDEVVPPPQLDALVEAMNRVIESDQPLFGLESRRVVPADPSQNRVWLVNFSPVRRGDDVVGIAAVLQDVTDVRRAEEVASDRLRELESVFRSAPVGLSYIDRDLRYVRVNQTIADWNGLPVEDVVGKSYRDLSPESADAAEPFFEELMKRAVPFRNLEVRSRPPATPDDERVFLLSGQPVCSGDGEVVGLMTSVQDVTDLRRTEDEAKRAAKRARARLEELEVLYANAPVGLCRLDADLRVVYVNPLFAKLNPRPPAEQVGLDASELLPPDIAIQMVPAIQRTVATAHPAVDVSVRGILPENRDFVHTWLMRAHPLLATDESVTGVIVVLEDITFFARQKEEIASAHDRLAEAQRVSRIGSWDWNVVDDQMWWSDELFEIFGRDPRRYSPSYVKFFEHVHPDDRSGVRRQIEETLASDEPCWVAFRIQREDGSERMLFAAAHAVRTEDGYPGRLLGTCQDVTEMGPPTGAYPGGNR